MIIPTLRTARIRGNLTRVGHESKPSRKGRESELGIMLGVVAEMSFKKKLTLQFLEGEGLSTTKSLAYRT